MRLIDADALKQSIREIMPSRTEVNILIDAQRDAIVRCRDCRFKECDGRNGTVVCDITGEPHDASWYCASGEKQMEATENEKEGRSPLPDDIAKAIETVEMWLSIAKANRLDRAVRELMDELKRIKEASKK